MQLNSDIMISNCDKTFQSINKMKNNEIYKYCNCFCVKKLCYAMKIIEYLLITFLTKINFCTTLELCFSIYSRIQWCRSLCN